MSAARDELTGDERAELHRLRRIVKQLRSLLGAPETAPVDERPEVDSAEPPAVAPPKLSVNPAEYVTRRRRLKGLPNG